MKICIFIIDIQSYSQIRRLIFVVVVIVIISIVVVIIVVLSTKALNEKTDTIFVKNSLWFLKRMSLSRFVFRTVKEQEN